MLTSSQKNYFAFNCDGCPVNSLFDKNFDVYESIFLGQVTGIHLTKYQERMVEGLKSDEGFTSWTDTTPNM
jgi:hypothetical protein